MHKKNKSIEEKQEELQAIVNSFNIQPHNPAIFKKNAAEKEQLKLAKSKHKAGLENLSRYNEGRNELIVAMRDARVPRWGSLTLDIVKY